MSLLEKTRKSMVRAINDFQLVEEGDRILCAVSGGKDSTIMTLMLKEIQRRSKINFEVFAVIVDQKQPGFNLSAFQTWFEKETQVQLQVIEEDTYSIVKEKTQEGKSYCGLCSRLRRGILYNFADKHRYSKIALGHHRDDANETVLMNMFYSGKIASMPAKLISDDKRNTVIRPMMYVAEEDLISISKELRFPIIPCNLCGSQTGLKRQRVKRLLSDLRKEDQNIDSKILASLMNVRPSQLLDKNHYTFS